MTLLDDLLVLSIPFVLICISEAARIYGYRAVLRHEKNP